MELETALKLFGSGGFAGALLYLMYLVGNRIVSALDRVATKIDAHTDVDLAAHAEVRRDLTALNAKLDERIRARTPGKGTRLATEGE